VGAFGEAASYRPQALGWKRASWGCATWCLAYFLLAVVQAPGSALA